MKPGPGGELPRRDGAEGALPEPEDLPKPLGDPLRNFRSFLGGLILLTLLFVVGVYLYATIWFVAPEGAHRGGSIPDPLVLTVLDLPRLVFMLMLLFAFWRILPGRRTNAFYLRSFVNDTRTLPIRQQAQAALGRTFRLSGIRDPRHRWPPVVRWVLSLLFAFRYSTAKYMNLEAGDDWKARLWRSLGDARCALIDVSEMTPFVVEEIQLCYHCLGVNRILFVGDNTRDSDGWQERLAVVLPSGNKGKDAIQVAIWTETTQGRQAFRDAVHKFAARLPEDPAGFKMTGRRLVQPSALPEGPSRASEGHGWAEFILGSVLGAGFFAAVGLLRPDGGAFGFSGRVYFLIAGATAILLLVCLGRYLLDCGSTRERVLASITFGAPLVGWPLYIGATVIVVQDSLHAAQRSGVANDLHELGMAMLHYHDTYNRLPPAASCDENGKPLLSWRVLILPYIEQENLYRMFKLDEPWDGPHNKKLLAYMPKIYATPGHENDARRGLTCYQVFVGPGAMFEKPAQVPGGFPDTGRGRGVRLADVPDGLADTILVVRAADPVPWTKPEDMEYDPKKPLPSLAGAGSDDFSRGRFPALFADGSVAYLPAGLDERDLRALITRNGREAIRMAINERYWRAR